VLKGRHNFGEINMRYALAGFLIIISCTSNASVIVGSVEMSRSASTGMIEWDNSHAIDQSGLSNNYVSGVTDFDDFTFNTYSCYSGYVCGFPTTGSAPSDELSGVGGLGSFYFDLGSVFSVTDVGTWVYSSGSAQMEQYDLYASDTFGVAGSRILIGSNFIGGGTTAFTYSFDAINARFFEIDVTANQGASFTAINEVVFGASAVPIPAAVWLFGSALAGLGWLRRKQTV
jgi:hypothetical protein